MYEGVPMTLPARDRSESESPPLRAVAMTGLRPAVLPADGIVDRASAAGKTLASPQSITWTSPKEPTMTFDGFKSRWITPRAWA